MCFLQNLSDQPQEANKRAAGPDKRERRKARCALLVTILSPCFRTILHQRIHISISRNRKNPESIESSILSGFIGSWHRESDPGPPHYQCDALPTEPCQLVPVTQAQVEYYHKISPLARKKTQKNIYAIISVLSDNKEKSLLLNQGSGDRRCSKSPGRGERRVRKDPISGEQEQENSRGRQTPDLISDLISLVAFLIPQR